MKKKLAIILTTFTFLLVSIMTNQVHAIKNDTGTVGMWHVESKNADQKDIAYIYTRYSTSWGIQETGKFSNKNYSHWTPAIEPNAVSWTIDKPGEQYNQIIIEIGTFGDTKVEIKDSITTYSEKITYELKRDKISIINADNNAVITTIQTNTTNAFRIYWIKAFGGDFTTVDKLPTTTGNLERSGGSMARVKFHKQGLAVISEISYYGEIYYIKHNFNPDTDMSIFDANFLSYYYVDNAGNKMILINHGDKSHFLNPELESFIPYTFWNLTTNEIKTVSKFDLMLHIEIEKSNNAAGYFYVDQFIIENLLQVETSFKYHYVYDTFFWQNSNGEEMTYSGVLEADKTNTSLPTWQETTFTGTLAAVSVAVFFPVVRWPALLIGGLIMFGTANDIIDYGGVQWGSINQIQKMSTVPGDIAGKLEREYSKSAGRPVQIDPTSRKKVYKLNFGQFSKFGASHIEIVPNSYKVISFTYETSDAVKTTYVENDFDLKISWSEILKHQERSGVNPEVKTYLIYGLIIIYVLVLFKSGGMGNMKKFIETTITFAAIALLIYGVWTLNSKNILLRIFRL